tara:strand:- start:689 stop:898 length:210 start_codon:yes stop_codon:yes gene_type:complete
MPKENKYANRSQINGKSVAVPMQNSQSAKSVSADLDRLTKGKENLVWEMDNWSKSIRETARAKGIRLNS